MIPAFYLKNHRGTELFRLDDVAKLAEMPPRPQFPNKDAMLVWSADPATEHCYYLLGEPENPALAPNDQTNPVKYMHGLVVDYDGVITPEVLAAVSWKPGYAPTWTSRTFSSGARIIWVFEEKIPIFNKELWKRFSMIMARELKLEKLLPGFDRVAFEKPGQHFELGTDWHSPRGPQVRLSQVVVNTALHDASKKMKWETQGELIPIEKIAEEVERRWPGRWVGEFAVGAQGVRFWDPAANNPTGAWIRETGVQAFTGEGKFLRWGEILGEDFVKQFRAERIGGAIKDSYFDGQLYWQKDEEGIWQSYNSEATKRRLNVMHGLSSESKKGSSSEVSNAITAIENLHHVDGAFPLLFMPDQIVVDEKLKYLNISRASVVPAGPTPDCWGDGFPWLAKYLEGIFGEIQLQVFLTWLARFYVPSANGTPKRGHALFIAGPQSVGKTFLAQRVIGALMGGFREATDFVLGATTFNEDLAYAPVWAIDDGVASADPKRHAVYSQIVKKIVANPKIQFHPKFKKAVTQRFNGRLIVTMNDDPESIQMLPQVEASMLDKVDLLRAGPAAGISFIGAEEKVVQELPALAAYLMIHEAPDWLLTRPDECVRFGHDSWHHPELLQTAKQSSSSVGLLELLEIWRKDYFNAQPDKTEWVGNASELLIDFGLCESLKPLVDKTCPTRNALGRDLQKLVAQGHPWIEYTKTNGKKSYTIKK